MAVNNPDFYQPWSLFPRGQVQRDLEGSKQDTDLLNNEFKNQLERTERAYIPKHKFEHYYNSDSARNTPAHRLVREKAQHAFENKLYK